MEQDLLSIPGHLSSLPAFRGTRVTRCMCMFCVVCPLVSSNSSNIQRTIKFENQVQNVIK
jgi:hypothetical protein